MTPDQPTTVTTPTATDTPIDPSTAARALLSPAALALFEEADASNDTLAIRIKPDRFQLVHTDGQGLVSEVVCDTRPFTRVYVGSVIDTAQVVLPTIAPAIDSAAFASAWAAARPGGELVGLPSQAQLDHLSIETIGRPIQSPT